MTNDSVQEVKHTPGPWHVEELAGIAVCRIHDTDKDSEDSWLCNVYDDDDWSRCKANAYLIAAAPDLLAALEAEEDAYELGLATGMENWHDCTRIMQKRGLSLELSAEDATDQLTMLARHLRVAAMTSSIQEASEVEELTLMEHQAQEAPYYQSNVELDSATVLTVRSRIADGDTVYWYLMVVRGRCATLDRDDALRALQALIRREAAAAVAEAAGLVGAA